MPNRQALPRSWVDAIFARLSVRYGAAFLRQWPDVDPVLIKSDWSEVLGGFGGDDISYALEHLPAETPPTAMQFRELCRRAPGPAQPKLPGPRDPMPETVRVAMRNAVPPDDGRTDAQRCVDHVLRIAEARADMGSAQRHVMSHCVLVLKSDDPRRDVLVTKWRVAPASVERL